MAAAIPGLRIVLPTVPTVAEVVRQSVAGWSTPVLLVDGMTEKFDAFAAATAALAASGTVTLELALSGTPNVVAYRIHPISGFLAKHLLTVPHVALANIVVGRRVVPELIQSECTPDKITAELLRLFSDAAARQAQKDGFSEIARRLSPDVAVPSDRAADLVLQTIAAAQTQPINT